MAWWYLRSYLTLTQNLSLLHNNGGGDNQLTTCQNWLRTHPNLQLPHDNCCCEPCSLHIGCNRILSWYLLAARLGGRR